MEHERHGEPRRARRGAALVLISILAFEACRGTDSGPSAAPALQRFEREHPAMGTLFRITLFAPDAEAADRATGAAWDAVDRIERAATDYDRTSEARQLAALGPADGARALSPELARVARAADALVRETNGAFDPTVGALSKEWRRALRQRRWPKVGAWDEARARVGWRRLVAVDGAAVRLASRGLRLDFGGVAKGVAVDAALEALAAHRVEQALVDGGGDLGASGAPPGSEGWNVLLRPGAMDAGPVYRATLVHGAVATSGDAYRSAAGLTGAPLPGVVDPGARFGHVLDPRTGVPLRAPRASIVFADSAARADGLATALLVLGPDGLGRPAFRAAAFFGGRGAESRHVTAAFAARAEEVRGALPAGD